ncbi:transposase [Clostridium neonatale]|uniref:transposase n=1 Tax=Clostridium neonatale TaxID=137838 RepID=UPI003D32B1FD
MALAKDKRGYKGKVASEICNKGYCATKDFHYYGCKLHVIANVRPKTTPYPEYALLTQASVHDLEAVRELLLNFENRKIYADRAYADSDLQTLANANGTVILTPYKRKRGEKIMDSAQSLTSTAISKIRQPIESLSIKLMKK